MKPAKRPPGRPRILQDVVRATISLDRATYEKAERIGNGKVSPGIRAAVQRYKLRQSS